MNSPIEPAHIPDSAAAVRSRPWIGRSVGSTSMLKQDRAVRTREAIIAVAAHHFDIDGYGNTSINTIIGTGKFAKGAIYYHFPSKEAIAEHLISNWNRTLADTVREALVADADSTIGEKLTAIFTSLAHQIAEDTNLRAEMKLTMEPTVNNGAAFAHWVDAISTIVDTAITAGDIPDTPPHTASPGTCAPGRSEPPTHQQFFETTSISAPASKRSSQRTSAALSRESRSRVGTVDIARGARE